MVTPSNSQVDKAGATIRRYLMLRRGDPKAPNQAEFREAVEVIWTYRSQFSVPMRNVNNKVRYYIKSAGVDQVVTQRLKRVPRMAQKLTKQLSLRLSQMQDVGGVRAVLPDQATVNEVLAGIERNWDIVTIDDYEARPRTTGYRAKHVITRSHGRCIELQLRTPGQQDWADEIERLDGLLNYAIKDGEGTPEMIEYTRGLADMIAAQERGEKIDPATRSRLAALRATLVVP